MADTSGSLPAGAPWGEGNMPGLLRTPSESTVGKDDTTEGVFPVVYLDPGLYLAGLGALYLGIVVFAVFPMYLVMVDVFAENLAKCDVVRSPPVDRAEDAVIRLWIEPLRLVT